MHSFDAYFRFKEQVFYGFSAEIRRSVEKARSLSAKKTHLLVNAILFSFFVSGCQAPFPLSSKPRLKQARTYHAPLSTRRAPNEEEFCAWFGDAREGVLYFGISAFWNEYRRDGNNPLADLDRTGPLQIGRYDLERLRFLPPLTIATKDAPTGSWDVLAHPNGRIYFSSLFDLSGSIDPRSGEVERFVEAGLGLNELALGPNRKILASRYASEESGKSGSVVLLSETGKVEKEFSLRSPPGYLTSPKTVAYDPSMQRIWVVSDLVPHEAQTPSGQSAKFRYDTRILNLEGHELVAIEAPEILFVRFDDAGTGYLAIRNARKLELQILPSRTALPMQAILHDETLRNFGTRILLSENFSPYDFVQEITLSGKQVVLTSWSGEVHVWNSDGATWHAQLPIRDEISLYYTGVIHGAHLCATYCADVAVSCIPLPHP